MTQVIGDELNADDLLADDLYIVGTPEHAIERVNNLKADYPDIPRGVGPVALPRPGTRKGGRVARIVCQQGDALYSLRGGFQCQDNRTMLPIGH